MITEIRRVPTWRVCSLTANLSTVRSIDMPREHRKRGKKHRIPKGEAAPVEEEHVEEPEQVNDEGGPSRAPDAPFGLVDPDVKAYFRTVDDQLKEWQDDRGDVDDGAELNEG